MFLARSLEGVLPIWCSKHPDGAMMLSIVDFDDQKMLLFWFRVGLKIKSKIYVNIQKHVLPGVKARYPNVNCVFLQDSAPAHKAKKTQKMYAANFADFRPASILPPASPDLLPFHYVI